jgi:hypothetical protein
VLSIDSTVAISCLSLEGLGYFTKRKKRTRNWKIIMREVIKITCKTGGKRNKKKNNSLIHA